MADVPEVEVAVLGPVEVRGAARPFTRASAAELVVYLALHPRGASSGAWASALWPDRAPAPATLHSTASAARRALGRSASGGDHLPRRHGHLRLAPTVGTDWGRLRVLAADDRPASWRAGLDLVRGRPFEELRASDWTVLEGIAAEVERDVVTLAARVAEHRLSAGDAFGASAAVRRGLLASPYDERLYRILLRAADAAGNPAGVESAMGELARLVAATSGERGPRAGGDPCAYVHPLTAGLYRSLSRRHRPVGTRAAATGGPLARL